MALPRSPARSTTLARLERRGSTLLHVKRTLRALRAEAPKQYALVTNHIRRAPGKYLVGPERFTVTVDDGRVSAAPGWHLLGAKLELQITPNAIVQLFDGTTTVEQLVARDVLRIKAEPDALLAFDDVTRTIGHAAIGSHALQMEFERYRTWVLGRADLQR